MPLFRQESLRSQDRLHGDVNLAPPTAWQAIGIGMVLLTFAFIIFLSFANYSRIATAQGVIESDRAVIRVSTQRSGIVERVLVREGDVVKKGQALAVIKHATTTQNGTLESQRAAAVAQEVQSLNEKEPSLRVSSSARIGALSAEMKSAQVDQVEIASQIEQQRQLVESAEQDLAKVREVAQRGFISQRDVRIREETLVNRRQELSRLVQSRSAAAATEAAARQRITQEQADIAVQIGDIAGARASLQGRAADDENAEETILIASSDGTVIGPVVIGQTVPSGYPILDIIPSGGKLRARLTIPAEAVATVSQGQTARVSIDAFPYQTYGTIGAVITQVSTAAIIQDEEENFIALAEIQKTSVRSYGKERPLRPGMKVTARIRTMERTLAQWLLDPIYAVTRR